MFKVWQKIEDGVWGEARTFESLWSKWQFQELLDGKICEYTKGVFFTMEVPEGDTKIPYKVFAPIEPL